MMSYNPNRWSRSTPYHLMISKNFKKRDHSRFSGNRKDPLNLNELIRNKQLLTRNHDFVETNINGNDRPIEILLQPNIYDPLRLDISLYNNENSFSFNSIDEQTSVQQIQRHFQSTKFNWSYDHQVPEQRMIR